MAIPNNITKDHLLKAISKIDQEGIPKDGDSKYYDVLFGDKRYPPKLIVSYANLFANKEMLDRNTFPGGIGTPCFNLLEENGFKIIRKRNPDEMTPKVWIEKTLVHNRKDRQEGDRALGKCLWSPRIDRRGADIYKNMREVKPGDIILHFIDNKFFHSVSKVKKSYVESDGLEGTEWDRDSYLVELEENVELNPTIERSLLLNKKNKAKLQDISTKSEVFYTSDMELRQGAYLTPCSIELFKLINEIYYKLSNKLLPYNEELDIESNLIETTSFRIRDLIKSFEISGLLIHSKLLTRFTSSLVTKSFLILTGLSGSGKTKLAQAFVKWISESKSQYRIIPIGADWTNREPLLGYPNALEKNQYIKPDSGALSLILEAAKAENQSKPFFLILDEMNLSHVERYFADFLSAMESGEPIPLHNGNENWGDVPPTIALPKNLFIIGTVNIDETTYMFSPKVLDRANVIEFRVTEQEMETYLSGNTTLKLDELDAQGAGMAASFVALANEKSLQPDNTEELREELLKFFTELKKTGAEFGYRSASEIYRFAAVVNRLDPSWELSQIIDAAVMQKLLPKVHGSRRKLEPVLTALGGLCLNNPEDFENYIKNGVTSSVVKYPVSLEKISRMYQALLHNGFTSYAEA